MIARDDFIPDLVNLAGAAEILGMTKQGAHKLVNAGKLPGLSVGGSVLVFRRALVEQLAERRSPAAE